MLTGDRGLARSPGDLGQCARSDCSRVMRRLARLWRLAGRHDQVQLIRRGLDGALGAAHVGHQRGIDDARAHARSRASTISASRSAGIALGETKEVTSILARPAARQRIDQRDLVLGRHECLFRSASRRACRLPGCRCAVPAPFQRGQLLMRSPSLRAAAAICCADQADLGQHARRCPRRARGADECTVPGVPSSLGTMPGTSTS